ncbi:hypothetical protein MCOR27_007306 [Pyricularia oryzae]|uniref:Dihydrofolate synthetase n=1 Tax=Pyricularia grisea TaxID=148305 RepID=A0ABQ8N6V5_PYRGI|nr:hypothetical protein MCOR01_000733 [Pyricularia oryzae]KAI6292247.1 hypothetical protein MCOR33_010001 [Pyricularia grisea]KAH9428505.1 hypothetical protein MCOR02_011053 [Pyricularia oryzae]KAI6258940.1 hypothetical protein MCOR19_004702 [Pyricularia oryzae]KAI6274670.1 hypothetical protein MCOR27_007306 [Pyricularia oryzae]
MINLGLARIARLVERGDAFPWRAVHVAGTNGKGSICAYISALLTQVGGYSVGRFNSPHMIDRWDCITLNERTVHSSTFAAAEKDVLRRNDQLNIGASEFELLSATAFDLFRSSGVDFGVVEVGLGGRDDATNVLENKAVTVISKIGLDHQSFLGNTLADISLHKAGIMRQGVPCVVDASNPPTVLDAIHSHAKSVGTDIILASPSSDTRTQLSRQGFAPHQVQNLSCALEAFRVACPAKKSTPLSELLPVLERISWPGRLQTIDIGKIVDSSKSALLDGAHNVQSAEVLAQYVNAHVRNGNEPVTWVLAASAGKDVAGIFELLVKPQDRVAAVRFGPVEGMPWVTPEDPDLILKLASDLGVDRSSLFNADADLRQALKWAASTGRGQPVVIAGSLYLAGDILRLLR